MLRNPIQKPLSYNAKKALLKGVIVGVITAAVYLTVVVITTPNLPPSIAVNAALTVNGVIIVGLAAGVGIQIFASSYSKGLGCRIEDRKKYQPKKGIKKLLYIGRGGSGDMKNTGLPDVVLDIAVFSLSLMGRNWSDYIKEAKRCLAMNGYLLIAETTNSLKTRLSDLRKILEEQGFDIYHDEERGDFIFIEVRKV